MNTAHPITWFRRLHWRMTLVFVIAVSLMGGATLLMFRHLSAQAALEATQRMNLGLARFVAEHQPQPLINALGRPEHAAMRDLAMHVMAINPAVEVYLLDDQGRVLDHALDGLGKLDPIGFQVDLAAVRPLLAVSAANGTSQLAAAPVALPFFGDDPLNGNAKNIVSVAALVPSGYLYIVLNGRMAQMVTSSTASSASDQAILLGVLAAMALTVLFGALSLNYLTRPLRALADHVQGMRNQEQQTAADQTGDEIAALGDAIQALEGRVDEQFKQAEEAERLRRELVSSISHDLRTPLSAVQGYLETLLIRDEHLDAATRQGHMRTALRHASSLGHRIAELFELSKLDAGRVQPKIESFCVAELLQDVIQSYQLDAQRRHVQLELATESHYTAQVTADIALIERVLQNLIDNALSHTPEGGRVVVTVRLEGTQARISVQDNGLGIAQEDLPHIFERYWSSTRQADAVVDPSNRPAPASQDHMGLGLAIVKRILDLHGSVVSVRSQLRQGTCFEFVLPGHGQNSSLVAA